MRMNKNTVLGWATLLMVVMGLMLIGLGIFKYSEISGWGFVAAGVGFLANAWVFTALKGRIDRKSTRLNCSHVSESRMPASA